MKFLARGSTILLLAALSTGCIVSGVILAPGADQVKISSNPADVSNCTAVGNISPDAISNLDHRVAQNQAVGLNADVVFNTGYGGVAYRCNNQTPRPQ
jgi:hypothetical protein